MYTKSSTSPGSMDKFYVCVFVSVSVYAYVIYVYIHMYVFEFCLIAV